MKVTPAAAFSGLIVIAFVVMAVFAPQLTGYGPNDVSLRDRLLPPGSIDSEGGLRALGTDGLGRDVWTRVVYGTRISLLIGIATVLIGGTLGLGLGLAAGYLGNRVEAVIMRIADIQLALPNLVLYVAILSVVNGSVLNIILILGLSGWVEYARVARAQILAVRDLDYVVASNALGASPGRTVLRHVLPNILAPIVVIASFDVARNIIIESSLSFIGIGVPLSVTTWGGMLSDGREYLRLAWWPATLPGFALMLLVLAVNLLGDWLRDQLDPRLDR